MTQREQTSVQGETPGRHSKGASVDRQIYRRFGLMIITAVGVMYAVTYLNTFELAHVRWSEQRMFMVMQMGATMAVVMLGFISKMYRNRKANAAILAGAVTLLALGLFLIRSQTTVQDRSYMSAMIPHHSISILTSERSQLADFRVCELAVEIIEAQRREI